MKRMLSVVSIAVIVSICQVSAIVAEELVLINGTLIDGTGDNPIANAALVVRDNRILAVGPYDAISIPENARIIDVKGATILPGFINAHVHDGYNEQNLQA
jgi:imidazolonepropionase-like amidohydrolase